MLQRTPEFDLTRNASSPIRIGVIGAGVFGGYHAQKFASLPGARLVGVYDLQTDMAEALCERVGAGDAFDDVDGLIDACDAVVIATPASTHAKLARKALEASRHALVEKPLALTGVEARELAALAVDSGLILQVGHQERLVFEAMGLFDIEERPLALNAVRKGPRSPEGRCEDVSVVFDLMIHDLDLAAELFGCTADEAVGAGRSDHTRLLDEADANLRFGAGRAHLEASRCANERERRMRIEYASGVVEIDFLTRAVSNTTPYDIRVDVSDRLPDPLRAAGEAFLAAIRGEAVSPITGGVGARAAQLAERVETNAMVAEAA